jgi:steroid delta-isomerase-like uncharacterized protein
MIGSKSMRMTVTLALLVFAQGFAAIASSAPATPVETTQPEMNKAVARRVFEEIFNQGKLQVADEIYAPDFVNHGAHRDVSLGEDQAAVRWEKQALPDLKMTVGRMVAEGDLVAVVWKLQGTNTAAISPFPSTGAKLELRGITVWRIVDGRIREEWTSFDELGIVRQVAYQLKWQLIGLLCLAAILLWMACGVIGKLWRRRLAAQR